MLLIVNEGKITERSFSELERTDTDTCIYYTAVGQTCSVGDNFSLLDGMGLPVGADQVADGTLVRYRLAKTKQFDKVLDSGTRREAITGAVRDAQVGKGRFDLLPFNAILRLAQHFENGSAKYGDNNWRRGMPLSWFLDSAMRHLFKFMDGQQDEDHLAAAIWNCCCLLETETMIRAGILPKELDDLLPRRPK